MLHKTVFTAFRLIISLGLIYFIAIKLDSKSIVDVLVNIDPYMVIISLIPLIGMVITISMRWFHVLRAMGHQMRQLQLFKIVMVGLVFNQVLPTSIGGDFVRVWRSHMVGIPLGTSTKSVIIERAFGLLALLILFIAGAPFLLKWLDEYPIYIPLLLVLVTSCSAYVLLLTADKIPWLNGWNLFAKLTTISVDARRIFRNVPITGRILALSLLGQIFTVITVFILARGMSINLTLLDCLILIPPVLLITVLPISIAGWGVRESLVVFFLEAKGIPTEAAFVLSVLFGLTLIIISLPGVLIWLMKWDINTTYRDSRAKSTGLDHRM